MKKETRKNKSKNKEAAHKTKSVKKERSTKKQHLQKEQEIEENQQIQQKKLPFSLDDQGLTIKVNLHQQYTIKKQEQIAKHIKNWFVLYEAKQKRKNPKLYNIVQFSYYPHFQFELSGEKPESQKCSICQFQYESIDEEAQQKQLVQQSDEDLVMLQCPHIMHYNCLQMLLGDKQWIKCPICSTIFGKMIGDQPPGDMYERIDPFTHCEGYQDCGTISITYKMYAGTRGDISFPGTTRQAYLPDNQQGRQVLGLLRQAFSRKLIFTVGRSVTTGRDNQIVWNGVHHKTNLSGGSAYFGYPDPTYFDRVKLELAAKGVS